MTDFHASWTLSRGRFVELLQPLSEAQLAWRMHPASLTIAEAAFHVAGVEAWFIQQLTDQTAPVSPQIVLAATEGVVNDHEFPVPAHEMSKSQLMDALKATEEFVRPHMESPSPEFLQREIKSALGPMITGHGALARLAFHPGYHHGQAYLMLTSPDFPR
jgi:hypothetical protein